jgi:hypothetical protein
MRSMTIDTMKFEEEAGREREGVRRQIERDGRVEIEQARRDHRERRQQRADPEADGQRADRFDLPVEQRDVQRAHHHRHHDPVAGCHVRPDVLQIL